MSNRNSEFGDIMPISGNLSHEDRMAALGAFGDGAKLMSNPDGSSYLQLTDEQRKAALEKAAAARHARAELREKIKKGETSLEDVLDSDDPIAARMKVSALIESLPGYGKAKATKVMDELGISATRRVKGLGARQREQLLGVLSK